MHQIKSCFYILFLIFVLSAPAFTAQIPVVTTYNYIASIVQEIGGERVTVFALANASYDPHTIVPKPSFIAKLRRADLFIINGAQLEIGWVPPLLSQANNPALLPGQTGFLDLSKFVSLRDAPNSVSRGMGDIHPDGNPHFYLDPHNIPFIAKAITDKLADIDPDNSTHYAARYNAFSAKWSLKLKDWDQGFANLKNVKVIEYHRLFDYILKRYGIILSGTVEPLPGIPPSAKYILELEKKISAQKIFGILQDVYNPKDASQLLANKNGIKLIVLPHDVNSVNGADDIFALFDVILRRLSQ
jgi:zinc/manganese transport system substrate-binding protein